MQPGSTCGLGLAILIAAGYGSPLRRPKGLTSVRVIVVEKFYAQGKGLKDAERNAMGILSDDLAPR
jgi:hypothetical protein